MFKEIDGKKYYAQLEEAAAAILNKVSEVPQTVIVLGSGLSGFAAEIKTEKTIPYSDIPHMPLPSTQGHIGNLIIGTIGETRIAAFQGRVHIHDNIDPRYVPFGLRVMCLLGMKNLILTNAAGGLDSSFTPGDIMVISNHLSLFLPTDPTLGIAHQSMGNKFYGQTFPYDPEFRALFHSAAKEEKITTQEGVYAFVPGPRYESHADCLALKSLGALAVGMSTVPEVLAVKALKPDVKILGISVITNVAAGFETSAGTLSEPTHLEVEAEGRKVELKLSAIVKRTLTQLNGSH